MGKLQAGVVAPSENGCLPLVLAHQLASARQRPVLGELRPGLVTIRKRSQVLDFTGVTPRFRIVTYLKEVRLSDVDRFVIKQLWAEWQDHLAQRLAVSQKLKAFVAKAPQREAEAREILLTAPGVGPVTAEVVLSELGDISRFRNAKTVCAYAGLVPVVRQSGERKSKDMKITKEGSGLLRWALVEAAWRLVGKSPQWAALFARLMHRSGKKRAIVAVARKLLCVLYAMLKTSTPYKIVTSPVSWNSWRKRERSGDTGSRGAAAMARSPGRTSFDRSNVTACPDREWSTACCAAQRSHKSGTTGTKVP